MTEAAPLLAGALTDFALADVLQLLELGARSGVLAVDGGPLGAGRVWVRRGRVVQVALPEQDGTPDVAGVVAALLELPRGRWTFHAALPPQSGAYPADPYRADGVSISALLVEAARGRDERERNATDAPRPADDVPHLTLQDDHDAPVGAGPLTAAHLRVLAAVDGLRDVGAIAAALRLDPERVRDALGALRALGLIALPDRATRRPEAA